MEILPESKVRIILSSIKSILITEVKKRVKLNAFNWKY